MGLEDAPEVEEPEDEAQMKTFKDFREEAKPVEKPSKDKLLQIIPLKMV